MMKTFLTFLLLWPIFVVSGFEITLGDNMDYQRGHGWKFPEGQTFTYFNSTKDIGHSFLPVRLSNQLSERMGVWVIRHKDFLHVPDIFVGSREPGKVSIQHSSSSIFFYSAKLKFLNFGEVSIKFIANANNVDRKHGIDLGSNFFRECLKRNAKNINLKNTNTTTESSKKRTLNWLEAEIYMTGATKMELEIMINHSDSFLILDEILVSYSPTANPDSSIVTENDTSGLKEYKSKATNMNETKRQFKNVQCKVER